MDRWKDGKMVDERTNGRWVDRWMMNRIVSGWKDG